MQTTARAQTAIRGPTRHEEPVRRADRPTRSPRRLSPAAAERRRRQQHFRLRRRDLLVDAVLGLVLAILLLSETAGLGILAVLLLPATLVLLATGFARRRRRRSVV
jgi:hypothetical protein